MALKKTINIQFIGAESLAEGLSELCPTLGINCDATGKCGEYTEVVAEEISSNISEVHFSGNRAVIRYGGGKTRFFRALAKLVKAIRDGSAEFSSTESPLFITNGTMMDVSRNAVLRPETIKYMLRSMALMGMNTFMLYTEDTYEIKSRPYFGYMRGRYTKEEIRDIDKCAISLGIELVPCIQFLGHLATAIRWYSMAPFADTTNCLLEGCEETYKFLSDALASIKECFTSRRLHMGMDETHDLGTGKHLEIFGYEEREEIYFKHLKRVSELALEEGFRPMLWSDMFFRMTAKKQGILDYNKDYDPRVKLPDNIGEALPKGVQPVFWDYYNPDEEFYTVNIIKHRLFRDETLFAGGIWLWGGFAPQFTRSIRNSIPALEACRKEGIREVIATVWHNGAEASLIFSLAGLAIYADYDYTGRYDRASCASLFALCCDEDYEEVMAVESIEYPEEGNDYHGSSRILMYNDPLMGLFDKQAEGIDLTGYYKKAVERLSKAGLRNNIFASAFAVIKETTRVLELKADFGIRLKAAYDAKDKETLGNIAEECGEVITRIEALRRAHRASWMEYNKPFGWEVHDLRYGALIARFDSARERISEYLGGKIAEIEELEETRLYFTPPQDGMKLISDWEVFTGIFTANII